MISVTHQVSLSFSPLPTPTSPAFILLCSVSTSHLQQLMRERQQIASRPFASAALALYEGGDQVDLLQGGIEVSFPLSKPSEPLAFHTSQVISCI